MLRLFADRRIGGVVRYYLAEEEDRLLVPDEIRQSVAFLYMKRSGSPEPMGTTFFVGLEDPDPESKNKAWIYAVTARHVLNGIEHFGDDGKAYFRMNLRRSGAEFIESELTKWWFHPDSRIDIAVLPWAPPFHEFETRVMPLGGALTPEIIKRDSIGPGDEVFVTGLFVNHLGGQRNVPIVRVGNIAAMPGEPIHTELGAIPAYLIEARSIGGLSGSPAFVHLGLFRYVDGKLRVAPRGETHSAGVFYLMGIVHGHYDLKPAPQGGLTDDYINMGIAIVTPIERLFEVLNHETLADLRRREKDERAPGDQPRSTPN